MKTDSHRLCSSLVVLVTWLVATHAIFSTTALAQNRDERAKAVADLSNPNKEVRLRALTQLVDRDRLGFVPESALEPLLKLASDEDVEVQGWTMSALGMLGPKHIEKTRSALLKGLRGAPEVATPAAMALGRIKDVESAKALVPLTEEKTGFTRHYAAEALSVIGGKEAEAAILKYAQRTAPELLEAFRESEDEPNVVDAEMFLSSMLRALSRLGLQTSPVAMRISEALH